MINHKDLLGQPIEYGDMIVYSNSSFCKVYTGMVVNITPKQVNGCYPSEVVVITDKYKELRPQEYARLLKVKQDTIDKNKNDKAKQVKSVKKTYQASLVELSGSNSGIGLVIKVCHDGIIQGAVNIPKPPSLCRQRAASFVRQFKRNQDTYRQEPTGKLTTSRYSYATESQKRLAAKHIKGLLGSVPETSVVVPFDSIKALLDSTNIIGITEKELLDSMW